MARYSENPRPRSKAAEQCADRNRENYRSLGWCKNLGDAFDARPKEQRKMS